MKKQHKNIELSIVIPAYKEERCIEKTLDKLVAYLDKARFIKEENVEVIIVSADSPDKTHEIIKNKEHLFTNFKFVKPGPRLGKGRDVKSGMLVAGGKAVLFMDADLATPLKYIEKLYKEYNEGASVVIAIRDFSRYRTNLPRIFVSTMGNILFRIAVGLWVEDSQCGFKLFSTDASQICFNLLQITGWGFDMEVLAAAKANKFSIKTVRVHDWTAIPNGTFEDEIVRNSLQSFIDLSYIFYKRLTGRYKKAEPEWRLSQPQLIKKAP